MDHLEVSGGGWGRGASTARLGRGGEEFTASGVPRETSGPWDLAFPPILAPARPTRPPCSRVPGGGAEWAELEALGVDGAVALMREHAAAELAMNKASRFLGVYKVKGRKAKP